MKPASLVVLTVVVMGFAASPAAAQEDRAASGAWDREGAARYLDERMDLWFANADKLRTGEAKTACVSCHTTVPYVMARPVLRRAMQAGAATPQETRLLQETTRRVETYGAHQLLYEAGENKQVESRGTEAVLNALILASADVAQDRRAQAFGRLWETQRPDGAWDWLDFGLEPFETVDARYYGATLAALAVGMAPGSPASGAAAATAGIERLRGYLQHNYASQRLFNRSWLLLASTYWEDLLTPAQRETLLADLQRRQRDDGGWALEALGDWRWSKTEAPFRPPGAPAASLLAKSDGYATGLIVYALRRAGLPAGHPAISRGLRWLRANQHNVPGSQHTWPGWRAHSLNFDREQGGKKGEPWRRMFMSDSATAFAVLALVASE